MSKPIVTWFANSHEHSVHFVKYGLMQLHRAGELRFRERPNAAAAGELPPGIAVHQHRRTAVFVAEAERSRRIIVLDGEDSLFQTSSLIQWCDVYYSCSYRRAFFSGAPFDLRLPWQTNGEVSWYQERYQHLQTLYAGHLHKARPLVPIGPDLEAEPPRSFLARKYLNLRHRLSRLRGPWIDWAPQYERFSRRWSQIRGLRNRTPVYDVVLRDSLWGWPRHRIALHRRLQALAPRFDIRAELHYRQAEAYELGEHPPPPPSEFPLRTGGGLPEPYEQALAASRVGVFATGFHYGCRNIVTLAWAIGLPVFIDPPSFEAIYDFRPFTLGYHTSGSWEELEAALLRARDETSNDRVRRQEHFDRVASPAAAARHLLATLWN